MNDRKVGFIRIKDDNGVCGLGEVAPIERLSMEDIEEVPEILDQIQSSIQRYPAPPDEEAVWDLTKRLVSDAFPSIRAGLEIALLDLLNGGKRIIFNKHFSKIDLPINGLVWMGDVDFMKQQIHEKLDEGFNCIKLKVGALDFDTEVSIIRELRGISNELIIRLDANGGFQVNEVLAKLKVLSRFNIHSIEQPILPMQPEAMEIVCLKSQIPIALDEELVWVQDEEERMSLLQDIRPHYLVLKPSLHGGFASVKNWIDLAEIHGINWWITSYLESNVGLNAIAQFASQYPQNKLHHGLGTGALYSNNIISPILIERGHFRYAESSTWGDVSF